MKVQRVVIGGIAGGFLLLTLQYLFSSIGQWIIPYDIFSLGGMRAMEDPVMLLFFAYPFIFAIAAAILYDAIEKCLPGELPARGIRFGLLLFLIFTIPNMFVIFTSMDYPLGFHLGNFLLGILGYPILGILFAKVGERFP